MSEQRLAEIAERARKAQPGERVKQPGGKAIATYTMAMPKLEDAEAFYAHALKDVRWLLANIRTAQAYIDRILSSNPNGGELMFLSRLRDILNGTDDGKEVNDE